MRGKPSEVVGLGLRTRARWLIDAAFVYASSKTERLVVYLRFDGQERVIDGFFTLNDAQSLADLESVIIQRAVAYRYGNPFPGLGSSGYGPLHGFGPSPYSPPSSRQIVEYDPQPF